MSAYLVGVVLAFLKHERRWAGGLTTDGIQILSYGIVIGRWKGAEVVLSKVKNGDTRTTKRHQDMLRDIATDRGIKVSEEKTAGSTNTNGTQKGTQQKGR